MTPPDLLGNGLMTSKSQLWADLNPIKNLGDQTKTVVQEQNPTSVKELWTATNSAWEGFPSDRLNNLMVSMSSRCAAVIRAGGGHTKY